jgi:hypothetical protein
MRYGQDSSIILISFLIFALAILVQLNTGTSSSAMVIGIAFAQQDVTAQDNSTNLGPLPENNSTDLLGPIPEDNSTFWANLFGDNSTGIINPNDNGTQASVPEFGSTTSAVLLLVTLSILVMSKRIKSQFKI